MGVGHPLMPAEHILRGLARIAARGVRTATLYEIGGVSVAMSKELPEGVFALRSPGRIEAYRDGAPIASVPVPAILSS